MYQFPSEFRNWKHKHWTQWSVAELHHWLYDGNLIDTSSQRLYSGHTGALRVFLAAVKLWTVVKLDIDHPNLPRAPHEWRFGLNEKAILSEIFEYLKSHLAEDVRTFQDSLERQKLAWGNSTIRNTPWQPKRIFYANMLGHVGPLDDDSLSTIVVDTLSLAQANKPTPMQEALGVPKSVDPSGMYSISSLTHLTISIGTEPSNNVSPAQVQHEPATMELSSAAGGSAEQVSSHNFAHFSCLMHHVRYTRKKSSSHHKLGCVSMTLHKC
jgi:hypothetical protein